MQEVMNIRTLKNNIRSMKYLDKVIHKDKIALNNYIEFQTPKVSNQ